MKRYLYCCEACGSAFIDPRGSLPLWCLCGGSYRLYELPYSLIPVSLADALGKVRAGILLPGRVVSPPHGA